MRLVDRHGVRPLDLGARCLAKMCAGSDLCSSANSAGPFVREAYDVPAEKSERPVLGEANDVRRPQDFGPRCEAKRVQGATCVLCPERLPACFGLCLVDGHGVRPLE